MLKDSNLAIMQEASKLSGPNRSTPRTYSNLNKFGQPFQIKFKE